MAEAQAEQKELPLEDNTEQVEVDLEEKQEKTEVKEEEQTETNEENLDSYSKKVNTRIDKLTYKLREAERREKAALDYAKNLQAQNNDLMQRSKTIDDSYIKEYDARVSTEEQTLQTKLTEAINNGDVESQVKIQKDMARLAVEAERLNKAKVDREESVKKAEEAVKNASTTESPQQQEQKPVHPKAKAWAEKNTWFGQDEPMTLTAFSIHKELVETEGMDPTSDEYYDEIDARIRKDFPHKFNLQSTPTSTPVAGATRSSPAKSGKKVTLSKSEVAIAKKLGVSLEQYARQKQYLNSRT